MKSKHRKHATLSRPNYGQFGRCEISIIGAPCGEIKKVVTTLAERIPFSATYIDADHNESASLPYLSITDGINHHRITYKNRLTTFDLKSQSDQVQLTIINGNHFDASSQIVFCTEKKKESLQRKVDRLTDVKMIVMENGISEPFLFLSDVIDRDKPIICSSADMTTLVTFVSSYVNEHQPTIKGLILAGGKSERMGQDKSQINYHGVPQWKYLYDRLSKYVDDVLISCRPEQVSTFEDHTCTVDSFVGLGPMGALLSAFREDPNAAYLMVACDLPLIEESHISTLINEHDNNSSATAYYNPDTGWPEPMLSIWTPRSYARLLQFLSQGHSCPRKVLINSDVKTIQHADTSFLRNANTPEEKENIQNFISAKAK